MVKDKASNENSELRKRAEKEFEIKHDLIKEASDMSPEHMTNLIHELQVHQIELKMQNNELRRLQEDLENTRDKYSHLYDFAPVGYFTVNKNGLIDEANLKLASLLGMARADLLGKPFTRFILNEDQDVFYKHRQHLLQTKTPQSCELRLVGKNKQNIYVRLEASVIENINNEKQIRVAVSDITESKKTEEMLKENENKYRTLFQSSSDAIFLVDLDAFKLVDANEKAIQLYGYEYAELLRMKPTDLSAEPEKTKSAILTSEDNMVPIRYHKKKDGTIFPVEITAIRLKLNDQRINMSSIRDISEIKEIEQQLIQAQKMESIGRLAGGVAHDYNNALTAIMGYTEMAMADIDPNGLLQDNLNEILKASIHAKDITRQLLVFASKQTIAPQLMELNTSIETTLKMLRRLIGEDIDLAWLPGKNLWPVKMDPSQIDQILVNLCVNAKDAITGAGKITIKTDMQVFDSEYYKIHAGFIPGGFIMVAISDNGCGMDKEILDHIFEPFFTTKGVEEGTGLGLATVYGIVKQNKGFINVNSE